MPHVKPLGLAVVLLGGAMSAAIWLLSALGALDDSFDAGLLAIGALFGLLVWGMHYGKWVAMLAVLLSGCLSTVLWIVVARTSGDGWDPNANTAYILSALAVLGLFAWACKFAKWLAIAMGAPFTVAIFAALVWDLQREWGWQTIFVGGGAVAIGLALVIGAVWLLVFVLGFLGAAWRREL